MIYSSTRIILLLGVFASVSAKFRFVPDPDTCARRKIHDSFTDSRGVTHNYFFSWEDDRTNNLQVTWSEARNICRRHCMDLVSPETPPENSWLKRRIAKGYISRDGIWTSGRKCNFDSQCNRADFYPLLVNGWFWSAVAEKIKPTDNSLNGDWSDTGATGRPQPDNYEALEGGDEGCLAILNNFYNDGIKWHDAACHHKKYFVCEDADDLLESVGANSSRNNRKKNALTGGSGNYGAVGNGNYGTVGNGNYGKVGNGNYGTVGDNNYGTVGNSNYGPAGNSNYGTSGTENIGSGGKANFAQSESPLAGAVNLISSANITLLRLRELLVITSVA